MSVSNLSNDSPGKALFHASLSPLPPFSSVTNLVLMTAAVLLIVVSTVANSMVVVAFFREKKLQKLGNYLLVNLALTDFVMCIVSVPLFTLYIVTGEYTTLDDPKMIPCNNLQYLARSMNLLLKKLARKTPILTKLGKKCKSCKILHEECKIDFQSCKIL